MFAGERLVKLRKKRTLRQFDVANILGVERTTYGKYENGGIQPPTDMIVKLAVFFNTTTDYLLGKSDDPNPPTETKMATVDDLAEAEGLGEENRKKLEDYLKLLKLSEMQQRNMEIADEFSVKE